MPPSGALQGIQIKHNLQAVTAWKYCEKHCCLGRWTVPSLSVLPLIRSTVFLIMWWMGAFQVVKHVRHFGQVMKRSSCVHSNHLIFENM
jgi:hypothetical protein